MNQIVGKPPVVGTHRAVVITQQRRCQRRRLHLRQQLLRPRIHPHHTHHFRTVDDEFLLQHRVIEQGQQRLFPFHVRQSRVRLIMQIAGEELVAQLILTPHVLGVLQAHTEFGQLIFLGKRVRLLLVDDGIQFLQYRFQIPLLCQQDGRTQEAYQQK